MGGSVNCRAVIVVQQRDYRRDQRIHQENTTCGNLVCTAVLLCKCIHRPSSGGTNRCYATAPMAVLRILRGRRSSVNLQWERVRSIGWLGLHGGELYETLAQLPLLSAPLTLDGSELDYLLQ